MNLDFAASGVSGATANNATHAFATFDPVSHLSFNTVTTNPLPDLIFYAWSGDTLVASAFLRLSNFAITAPYADGAPTPNEQFRLSGGIPAPEPGTFGLLGGLLVIFLSMSRRKKSNRLVTAT